MAAGKRLRTGDPLTEHDVADRIDRAALRTLDTVPEGHRTERAVLPGKLYLGDPVWVLDDSGASGWAGYVISVSPDAADIYYAGRTEAFSLPAGRRGSCFLFLGQVTCRGCDKLIAPARAGSGTLLWEDPDGITQCMKAAGPPTARVMHEPVLRMPGEENGHADGDL